jgi:hypothetical protein
VNGIDAIENGINFNTQITILHAKFVCKSQEEASDYFARFSKALDSRLKAWVGNVTDRPNSQQEPANAKEPTVGHHRHAYAAISAGSARAKPRR